MSIEEALQMTVSVAIGLVAICVIIKCMEWLIKDKSNTSKQSTKEERESWEKLCKKERIITREMLLPDINTQTPMPECKEPRIQRPKGAMYIGGKMATTSQMISVMDKHKSVEPPQELAIDWNRWNRKGIEYAVAYLVSNNHVRAKSYNLITQK